MPNLLFYCIAGEKSGDNHGSALIKAMKTIHPEIDIKGVGGSQMQLQGLIPSASYEEFQVMGFSDVFFALPRLARHFYAIGDEILRNNPKGVIFIDYPGFNIRLAKYLRKKKYQGKLIHYIAPSVWAWGKDRIQTMSQTLDLLLTIYPFEAAHFQESGLKTAYVGNPLMKEVLPLCSKKKQVLALFPGSRLNEIKRNLPLQIETAILFCKKHPQYEIAISVSEPHFEKTIHEVLQKTHLKYTLVDENNRLELMQNAAAALAKSGTVTLELALHGCPTVVIYQLTYINYFLAKHVFGISLPFYALPNILLNQGLFQEHYKTHIDPKDLAEDLEKCLFQQSKAEELRSLLTNMDAGMESAKEIFNLC